MPLIAGAKPLSTDNADMLLAKTWRSYLAVTGVDGMPALASAGNVLRPYTCTRAVAVVCGSECEQAHQ
jgi:hypothetical protein